MWLMSVAAAQTGPVEEIRWARPFSLAAPEPDPTAPMDWSGVRPTFSRGWIVELRAEPSLLAPSQLAEPRLYVGDRPAMRFNWDSTGGCLVAMIPAPVDLAASPLLLGAPPESGRTTASARAELARAEAERLRVAPRPAAEVAAAIAAGGPEVQLADLREVHALAMERVAACSSTPADLQRAGVPDR
jgi:hypothetical protein